MPLQTTIYLLSAQAALYRLSPIGLRWQHIRVFMLLAAVCTPSPTVWLSMGRRPDVSRLIPMAGLISNMG
jgi:hypothetical protein